MGYSGEPPLVGILAQAEKSGRQDCKDWGGGGKPWKSSGDFGKMKQQDYKSLWNGLEDRRENVGQKRSAS